MFTLNLVILSIQMVGKVFTLCLSRYFLSLTEINLSLAREQAKGFKSRETEFRCFCFRLSGLMCLM